MSDNPIEVRELSDRYGLPTNFIIRKIVDTIIMNSDINMETRMT